MVQKKYTVPAGKIGVLIDTVGGQSVINRMKKISAGHTSTV